MANIEIKDGEYTKTIYSMIKEQRYSEAVNILSFIYDSNPSSRAALSLLAYCYYYTQVSFSSCQRNLIKTFQIEAMFALITKVGLIFS